MTRQEFARWSRAARLLLDRLELEIMERVEFESSEQRKRVQAVLERELGHVRSELDQADLRCGVRPPLKIVRS